MSVPRLVEAVRLKNFINSSKIGKKIEANELRSLSFTKLYQMDFQKMTELSGLKQ